MGAIKGLKHKVGRSHYIQKDPFDSRMEVGGYEPEGRQELKQKEMGT